MNSLSFSQVAVSKKNFYPIFLVLIGIGLAAFLFLLSGSTPERGWQAYLINFLLWSSISQGALLFSAVMHVTKARWSGPLSGLAEAFAAFFPFSLLLFLLLFIGSSRVFPWLGHNLHGKEVWLDLPFLFTRDFIGLLFLYGAGAAYLYYSLRLRLPEDREAKGGIRSFIAGPRKRRQMDAEGIRKKMSIFAVLYILAFALVLTLLGFDLVMSMEPHWISTLFGAYIFIKAFYIGLGGIIVLAAIQYLRTGDASGITPSHFHDIGKLFFAFCMVWGDFFYAQLVVIWYGNIPEETVYVIRRTVMGPWAPLAWTVLALCFILPFFLLLNRRLKTRPVFMIALCGTVLIGFWLEHLLLLGPAFSGEAAGLPLGAADVFIFLGFFGLIAAAVSFFLDLFPELAAPGRRMTH